MSCAGSELIRYALVLARSFSEFLPDLCGQVVRRQKITDAKAEAHVENFGVVAIWSNIGSRAVGSAWNTFIRVW
jgi:hypothetical protein